MTKYWFRQKRFGYGATPNTWQGWAVTLVGLALMLFVVWECRAIADRGTRFLVASLGIAAVAVPMTYISYIKTEGGWRWRGGRD